MFQKVGNHFTCNTNARKTFLIEIRLGNKILPRLFITFKFYPKCHKIYNKKPYMSFK